MSKVQVIIGDKVYKRGVMSPIVRDDRVEFANPLVNNDIDLVTYYVTWVIIDGRRVDIQRLDGCRFWIPYTGDCD